MRYHRPIPRVLAWASARLEAGRRRVGARPATWLLVGVVAFGGSALWGDIVITEDDWDSFVELNNAAGTPPVAIVTTVDGRKSLHMTRPSGDKSALYQVNVTQMPAGMERFPVEVISRQVMDSSNGCTIRNLTLDPEPDPNFQGSFCSILMNDGGAGGPALARDDRWVLDPLVGEDPAGTIGMSGLQVGDPTEDTTFAPDDVTTTVEATL
ncbi:MAG: hypothetical protein O7J95_09815, partial [Planctomycetota bacterium]|nr:hypothetical protein [Planctomycetota bacterium]